MKLPQSRSYAIKPRYTARITDFGVSFDPGGAASILVEKMAGDADRTTHKGQEGTAVSSGESSAAFPKPALDSDAMTMAGIPDPDVTQVGTSQAARRGAASVACAVSENRLLE